MSGTVVGCDSNDDPGRGCHRDGVVVTVRSKLVWDGDDRLVSGTVTLFEGQIHGKLHRLIGGKLPGSVLSLEIRLNLLGGDISGITRGGLLVASGCRRGDSTRRLGGGVNRLSFSGDTRRGLCFVGGVRYSSEEERREQRREDCHDRHPQRSPVTVVHFRTILSLLSQVQKMLRSLSSHAGNQEI